MKRSGVSAGWGLLSTKSREVVVLPQYLATVSARRPIIVIVLWVLLLLVSAGIVDRLLASATTTDFKLGDPGPVRGPYRGPFYPCGRGRLRRPDPARGGTRSCWGRPPRGDENASSDPSGDQRGSLDSSPELVTGKRGAHGAATRQRLQPDFAVAPVFLFHHRRDREGHIRSIRRKQQRPPTPTRP